MWYGLLGKIGAANHSMNPMPDSRAIYQAPYRAVSAAQERKKNWIEEMLRTGVFKPATAEWARPVVIAPKKEGSMRFCIGYNVVQCD